MDIQQALAKKGYSVGRIDGLAGPETYRAVQQWLQMERVMPTPPKVAKALFGDNSDVRAAVNSILHGDARLRALQEARKKEQQRKNQAPSWWRRKLQGASRHISRI